MSFARALLHLESVLRRTEEFALTPEELKEQLPPVLALRNVIAERLRHYLLTEYPDLLK